MAQGEAVERPIGVVLVNPLPGALAEMHDLLSGEPGMEVFVYADDADEALEAMRRLPHRLGVIAVVTLGFDGEHDSFWLIRSIREIYPTLPVLACGTETDDATISWALFTGADGFVALEVEPAEFVTALRRVAQRELILEGLPSGWMAQEDELAAPVIVLPGSSGTADDPPDQGPSPSGEDLTLTLPEASPEATSPVDEGEVVVAAGRRPSNHPPSGSRIGRLFARRQRPDDPSIGETGSRPDSEDLG